MKSKISIAKISIANFLFALIGELFIIYVTKVTGSSLMILVSVIQGLNVIWSFVRVFRLLA